MYQQRLLPCSRKAQGLLGQRSSSVPPSSPGGALACCSAANLQGHPATFFVLHALGGAIVFLTDGIMVRLKNQGRSLGVSWELGPDLLGLVFLVGILRRLRLYLRRLPSSAHGPQGSRMSGQHLLGLHHHRPTGLHLRVVQVLGAQAAHLQSGRKV